MARNQRIAIYKPAAGVDALNQPLTGFVLLRETWADLRLLRGLQTVKADAVSSLVKGSAEIGWCTDLNDSMVVEYLGARYKVTAVLPDLREKRRVDLALEGVQ